MNIGYWGVPDTDRTTLVHVQEHEQRTLCGYTMSEEYKFQWCAKVTSLYMQRYIECVTCKRKLARMVDKELKEVKARLPKREPKKRNRATQARDTKEAAACADAYMNLTRCVGRHVIASGLRCPHCESYNPEEECHKEKIDLTKERPIQPKPPKSSKV